MRMCQCLGMVITLWSFRAYSLLTIHDVIRDVSSTCVFPPSLTYLGPSGPVNDAANL